MASGRADLQCLNTSPPYTVGLTLGDDCAPPCESTTTMQIESFDSAGGWSRSGNGASTISVDTVDQQEGAGALVWSSTVDEEITESFAAPKDLSSAAELRVWLRGNRTIGSACCGFSMRLLSGSGYFEHHVLPDVPPGAWVEDVSERDSWAPSTYGAPSWADIRGITFVFYGDFDTTTIAFDDLRMATVSSTTPAVRQSAGTVVNDNAGPFADSFVWSNPGNATIADGAYASVLLPDTGQFGFVSSRYLDATGFSFSIPDGGVITGIRVEIRQHRDVHGFVVWDDAVSLLKNGVRVGANHAYGDDLTATDSYRYYGERTDLWGVSWTPADINSPNFGAAVAVATHSPPEIAYVDDTRIGVYYDPPPGPASCRVTGCSGQLCADRDVATTCEWQPEYACYRDAHCEQQSDGQCDWTPTEELEACLLNNR
jgi:hypothetical protein